MLFYSYSCEVFERVIHSLSFHCDTTTVLDASIMYICVSTGSLCPRLQTLRMFENIAQRLSPSLTFFVSCTLGWGRHSGLYGADGEIVE